MFCVLVVDQHNHFFMVRVGVMLVGSIVGLGHSPFVFAKLNSPLCSLLSLPLKYVEEDDADEILEHECMDKTV
jgi:hypothetical protein